LPKVFLVDDDVTTARLISSLLKLEGVECQPICDPDQVVSLLKSERPDALIVDVYLGARSGLELVKTIRERVSPRPMIIMYSALDHARECLSAGADAFLLKPFTATELLDLLKAYPQTQ